MPLPQHWTGIEAQHQTLLPRSQPTIPNPRKTLWIVAGDRLLCYGNLLAMKALLPARPEQEQAGSWR